MSRSMSRGCRPEAPVPRAVTTANFDEWCADPRPLTFEEYMAESIPADRAWRPSLLPPRPPAPPAPPPNRSIRR